MNSLKGKKKDHSIADFHYSCHCHTMNSSSLTLCYE